METSKKRSIRYFLIVGNYNIDIKSGSHEGESYQIVLDLSSGDFEGVDLNRTEKSSIFMRWIRQALKENHLTRVN